MLIDIVLLLFHVFLKIVMTVLGWITTAIGFVSYSQDIASAWLWVFSYAHLAQGLFPIDTVINVAGMLIGALVIRYAVEYFFMGWKIVPIVGTKGEQAKLPSHH